MQRTEPLQEIHRRHWAVPMAGWISLLEGWTPGGSGTHAQAAQTRDGGSDHEAFQDLKGKLDSWSFVDWRLQTLSHLAGQVRQEEDWKAKVQGKPGPRSAARCEAQRYVVVKVSSDL
jgi:hypothetical protein